MDTTSSSSKVTKEDGSSNGSRKAPEHTAGDKAPLPSSAVTFSPPANSISTSSIPRTGAAGSVAGAAGAAAASRRQQRGWYSRRRIPCLDTCVSDIGGTISIGR
mmetsp:Transcript_48075/g.116793  ORF Transcript_48075/g.116793 Transcript_48075/m.116793 type:complete len:104 (-) Transcript_48075:695-1006(-)